MPGPFGTSFEAYWRAGWRGLLPLPYRAKHPPPRGWTGRGAPYPSYPDVLAWAEGAESEGNIGLRLPDGVIGLDVDDYFEHSGGATLDALTGALGPLPITAISTARDDRSGIRLYRVPEGGRWPGAAGAGIEIIQAAHRYAVVWPSVHPELGNLYRWVGPPQFTGDLPTVTALPALPETWVTYLRGLVAQVPLADPLDLAPGEVRDWLMACRQGETCHPVRDVAGRATQALSSVQARGSRHELARDASRSLAAFGGSGHAGVLGALIELRDAFTAALGGERDAGAEWDRMLLGAVKLAAAVDPAPRQMCDCALWAGEALGFEVGAVVETSMSVDQLEPGKTDIGDGEPGTAVALAGGDLADILATRLMTPAQLRDLPAPEPLIEGLLTLDSASWLIARSGSYKSFVALDWAGHIAAGTPWMDRKVAHGPVVYMVAEGVAGMGPRVRAWEQRHGQMSGGIYFLPFPVQVGNQDNWAALIEVCRRISPVLVVLDTQARITVGIDENDNSAMGQAIEQIERLRRACGACVLVVHHIGRNGQDARGASAIDAAQDTELRLTRTADRRVTLTIDKARNGADDVRVDLELFVTPLDDGGDSLVVGPALGTVEPDWRSNLTVNQLTLVQIMADIFMPVGATKAELKSEARKRGRREVGATDADLGPMGESAFRRAWSSLVGAYRFIKIKGSERYVLGDPMVSLEQSANVDVRSSMNVDFEVSE